MKDCTGTSHLASSKLMLPFLLLLLAGAAGDFLWRGPLRPADRGDFISPYVAAVRFAHYADPYTLKNFEADWHAAGAPASTPLKEGMDAVAYPPSTLLVISPFVHLPWNAATRLYVLMCTALYVVLVYLLALQIGSAWSDARRLGFSCFALALAPVQTGIHTANLSIFAFLCCGFALLLAQRSRDTAAALLLTLGIFIKPTVGAALILLFLLTRRWKLLSICIGCSVALAALTAIHMLHIDSVWKADYQKSLAMIVSNNGPGSFTSTASSRFDLLNLQMPLYQAYRNATFANAVTWLVTLALAAAWIFFMLRETRLHARWNWADIGSLSLLSLLPIYQRNYNAGILIFSLVWAFQHIERRSAQAFLALSVVFLVPGEGWLRGWLGPKLPDYIPKSYPWNAFLVPHAAWAVPVLTCMMVLAMRHPEVGSGEPATPPLSGRRAARGLMVAD